MLTEPYSETVPWHQHGAFLFCEFQAGSLISESGSLKPALRTRKYAVEGTFFGVALKNRLFSETF